MYTIPENLVKPLKYAGILVGILLVVIVANETYKYFYYELPPKLVNVTVKYLPELPCRKDSPMHMLIVNDSYRYVIKTDFSLTVKVEEGSENLVPLLAGDYSTDELVEPGKFYEGCWSYPKLYNNKHAPESLIYSVKRKSITFSD